MIDYGFTQAEVCWGVLPDAEVVRIMQGIRDIGGSRVRMAVQIGSYENLDRAITLSLQYGLSPLLCLINNAVMGYTQTPAGFATFCKNVALRYGPAGTGQVTEYELFNEPNSSLNAPGVGDAAAFTTFLKAGYTAIKSVHTSSTVVCGGTIPAPDTWIPFIGVATNPVTWYQGIYAAGGKDYMDALGFHLYANVPPTPSMTQWKYMTDLRDVMVANGDSAKKVWVTETGAGFPAEGVKDVTMARDWLKIMVEGIESYSWTSFIYIYQYRNSTNNANDPNSVYGMVNNDFSPKSPIYEYCLTIRNSSTGGVPTDVTAPTTPTGVMVSDVRATTAVVTWNPSTDAVGVFNYRVYTSDGTKIAEVATTSANLSNLLPGTSYGVYVTALDAAGNESGHSTTKMLTTSAPSGLQALFAYDFTGTGSTVPIVFTQLGLGFTVSSSVALPVAPSTNGLYYTIAPYNLDQQSIDHTSEIGQATAATRSDRAALAIVRLKPDGTEWVAACINGVGFVDACKIMTCIGGVVRVRKASTTTPLLVGEKLKLSAVGNVYTATRIAAGNVSTQLTQWNDTSGAFPGKTNRRAGFGWRHKRVGAVNYAPPGITGVWRAADVGPVQPSGGVSDAWILGVADDDEWPTVIATNEWELGL